MTNQQFKNCLYQLVKNDYGFELYQANDKTIVFSFYHLNSVYNALCSAIQWKKDWYIQNIDWQYCQHNKKIENYVVKIVSFMVEQYRIYKNFDYCEKEVAYYKELSELVYKAKYQIDGVYLHTMN